MASSINTGRVIQGGLIAGVVINVLSMVNNSFIVGAKIMAQQQAGHYLQQPRIAFLPAWLLVMFLVGIGLTWLYAAVRPRLGPGPGTALGVGLVVGLLAGVPDNLATIAWSPGTGVLGCAWMTERIVTYAIGTLAGAWWYKEAAPAA